MKDSVTEEYPYTPKHEFLSPFFLSSCVKFSFLDLDPENPVRRSGGTVINWTPSSGSVSQNYGSVWIRIRNKYIYGSATLL